MCVDFVEAKFLEAHISSFPSSVCLFLRVVILSGLGWNIEARDLGEFS